MADAAGLAKSSAEASGMADVLEQEVATDEQRDDDGVDLAPKMDD